MKDKKNSVSNKLYEWVVKQSSMTDEVYRLSLYNKLPELKELKEVHSILLKRYVCAIKDAEKLSLFVNFYEYEKALRKPSIGRLLLYILNKIPPFSMMTLKPVLIILIETHIKRKLKELENIYIQTKSATIYYDLNFKEYQDWLSTSIHECQEFSRTLEISENIKNFFISLINLLVITGISTVIFTGIANFLSSSLNIALLGIAIIFISITSVNFFSYAFIAKRDIFLLSREDSVYFLENKLFRLLDRIKRLEWAIDYISLGLLFYPLLIILKLNFKVNAPLIHISLSIIFILIVKYFIDKRNKTEIS